MKLKFNCKHCGKTLKTDESKAGRRVKCPACSELLTIPEPVMEALESDSDFDFEKRSAVRRPKAKHTHRQEDDIESDGVDDVCEMCGADVPSGAKRCPACGERRPGFQSGKRRRKSTGELAGLGKRFLGAFLDGIMTIVVIGPAYALIIMAEIQERHTNDHDIRVIKLRAAGFAAFLLGGIALLAVQGWLMAIRSQSIGKFLVKTQVLDFETNQAASFVKVFLLRSVVNYMLTSLPCVGGIYGLVDICFIFSNDRRCVHDRIAGTYVANYEA